MKIIEEPKVYLIAKTGIEINGINQYLNDIGSPDWKTDENVSDGENLAEMAGRICYRSWQPYDSEKKDATNPNVKRVRKGNQAYIQNILESKHGSILEHINLTFILRGVSRVLTHELVRHRAGMAYSQESLRYVRLDDISFWFPDKIKENKKAKEKFDETVKFLEKTQKELAEIFNIDSIDDFSTKKKLTSIFRRIAPIGLGTSILVTGNLRAWRHIIAIRSSQAAEEEFRIVVSQIAEICKAEFPHIFQDMTKDANTGEYIFSNQKV
ncbi:MAG: FAD-dependent thymidylate synthase [Desulfobacterales bacterium]|nr:FAD-dependent thymidylate synthase [Desulfobacterales bacterium]